MADAEPHGPFASKLFVGDAVGYGPQPIETLKRLESEGFICVRGNHDRAVLDGNVEDFNYHAAAAAKYNRALIMANPCAVDYLSKISNAPYIQEKFSMVHGSFAGSLEKGSSIEPVEDIYIFNDDAIEARKAMFRLTTPLGIVGHTHVPMYFSCWINTALDKTRWKEGASYAEIKKAHETLIEIKQTKRPAAPRGQGGKNPWAFRVLINPGSVGQPRDYDKRAAYAILRYGDNGEASVDFRRVEYDIAKTQDLMRQAPWLDDNTGLSESLIKRLELGR